MILGRMLDVDDFEDSAGFLMILRIVLDFDDFQDDAGF